MRGGEGGEGRLHGRSLNASKVSCYPFVRRSAFPGSWGHRHPRAEGSSAFLFTGSNWAGEKREDEGGQACRFFCCRRFF